MKMRTIFATGAIATMGLVAIGVGTSGGHDTPAAAPSHKEATVSKKSERADLKTFKLDDRSAYGVTDIWVKFTLQNSSSHKSDYSFDWEAVNSKGERIDSGSELVTNVLPGQKAKGADFTQLKNTGVKLNITSFDRTESY